MTCKKLIAPTLIAALGMFATVRLIAAANDDAKSATAPEFKLPAGWTQEDMMACIVAGTPGEKHKYLAKGIGEWQGKNSMWMSPSGEPMKSESTATVTPMLDGRFVKCEVVGDMPSMGTYNGFGIYGFDNVSQKFVSTWMDNHGTGIMTGEGKLSADGKTMTWTYTGNCPITKKPTIMREVETITGPNTKTLEMFGADPKSGKEFKMMLVEMTKKTK